MTMLFLFDMPNNLMKHCQQVFALHFYIETI